MKFMKSVPISFYLFLLYFICFGVLRINQPKDISGELKYIADLVYYGVQVLLMLVVSIAVYINREVRKVYEKV
ncbi:hypothetical protein HO913_03350 [Streptococcus suis]|nr:hypothetical protein [Streptococcus suis]